MKDLFSREVEVGQLVGFNPPKYKGLKIGSVIKVSEKSCKIRFKDSSYRAFEGYSECPRNQVMILSKEDHPEYYLWKNT